MSAASHKSTLRNSRATWSNALIRFCGYGLILSSLVKFVHPPRAVAYMASMGFEGRMFLLVAILELISAVLFLMPATRRIGLLLVSSYLGGAIAAHLSVHRFFVGGPFLVYMAMHPYVGALVPAAVLTAGWAGMWLSNGIAMVSHRSQDTRSSATHAARLAVGQAS